MKKYIKCLLFSSLAVTASAQTTTQNQSSSITAEQFITQAALSGMKEVATGKLAKQKAQDGKVKSFGSMMVEDHSKANNELIALAKSKNIKMPRQTDIMPASSGMNNGNATSSNMSTTSTTGTGNSTGAANNTTTSAGNNTTTGAGNNTTMNNQTNGQMTSTNSGNGTTGTTDSLKMISASEVSSAIQQLQGLKGSEFDTAYAQMMANDHKNAIALFERAATSSDSDIKAFATKHLPTLRSHEKHVQTISGGSNSAPQSGSGSNNKGNH